MREIKFRAFKKGEKIEKFSEQLVTLGSEVNISKLILFQYLGTNDKNGKEICEGDIVDTRYGRMVVGWDKNMCGFTPFCGDINCPDPETESEVIGNIYENKELLN